MILHGWGSCAKNWDKAKELLEIQEYKVHAPDLPGFGDNPPPKRAWSIDDYVDWLGSYCEKQNLSQIFLLGHSFGGSIAVKFSLKYPEKIKKLFLVSPSLIRRKTLKKEIIKKISRPFSFLPAGVKKIIYRKVLKSDYPLSGEAMRETFLKVIGEDVSRYLGEVGVPTIIIWGENDDITPLKDAYLINKEIKKSRLIIIKNKNHDLNMKAPELLAEKVLQNI